MTNRNPCPSWLVGSLLLWSAPGLCASLEAQVAAQDNLTAAGEKVSYSQQIAPIFRQHCQGCHQPAKAQGEYSMTEFSALLQAGESGVPAIVPGKPSESYLLEQITPVDGRAAMPKRGQPLHAEQVALIKKWVAQGAIDDSPDSAPSISQDNPPVYSRAPVITALAYSPNGKWLASSGFHEVLLVDTTTWKTYKRLIGLSERIESISFSPDSKRIAVTGGSPGRMGEIQVWDVASGELTLSHQVTYDTIYGGNFSPDGKLIAFGCSDNTVRAIDAATGEQVLHQGAHDDWVRSCVFNPEGTHLLSAGRDMTVKLTEVETERFVDNVTSITPGALRGGISSLAMHPTRNEVLVGGADGIPKVYRIFRETERRIGDDANLVRKFPNTNGRLFSVSISSDGKQLAAVSTLDGQSQIVAYPYDFDGALPENIKTIMKKRVAERKAEEKQALDDYLSDTSPALLDITVENASLYSVDFAPNGKHLVVGGSDGQIRVVDLETAQISHSFAPVELVEGDSTGSSASDLLAGNGLPIPSVDLPDREAERKLLPGSKLLSLEVAPSEIQFTSRSDYAQLVVTAVYANGQRCDVTRMATIDSTSDSQGQLDVSHLGLVKPRNAGQAKLTVAFGGASQSIPVATADLNQQISVDFIRDVNPVLSRLGCNSGTCHGAQKGKAGFQLSLRGYDPVGDLRALADDLGSRRLNTAAPDASLMLLKPSGTVPHEGGVLLSQDSVHYDILRRWIAEGARLERSSTKAQRIEIVPTQPVIERPGAWQQFRVVAHYADGRHRDVTQEAFIESGNSEVCEGHPGGRVEALRRGEAPVLVRYEGAYAAATVTVMGDRAGFEWQPPGTYSTIDELVAQKWKRMKILPSPLTEDHEFLRRVTLDLTGLPPSAEELRAFLDDPRPSQLKRQAKIEQLLGSPEYIEHWTNKWADLLQVNSKFLGSEGAKAFRAWIRTSVAENQPYNEFAKAVLTASGSNKEHPAASYYKILREPDLMMENTTHLFLAVRFNCNKCHDHPFERWTQDQYYQLASYFAQTSLKADPASGNQKIGGTAVEGAKPLYEEVYENPEGEMRHVRTGAVVEPAFPYDCQFESAPQASRREQLAAWITSPDNPYFARSFVNRLWGYLLGTGLIEPLDDIRAGNPPSNPELLDHLTQEFIASDFDVQHVLRLICNSRTYQLSVASNQWNEDDAVNYSHAQARRLPAEVLYDAVHFVTGSISKIPGVAPGTRAAALPDVAVQLPDGFLNNLGRPVRESACECERSEDLQLGPVMALVSGPTVGQAISDPECALSDLASDEISDEQLIREIYLRVLSRAATDSEVDAVLATADQIAIDHQQLQASVQAREAWWQEQRARLEAQRLEQLEATKQAIVSRRAKIAPKRAKLEEQRKVKLAAAEKELADYRAAALKVANAYLSEDKPNANWFPLAPVSATASNNDRLLPQPDRSIIASGKAEKGVYTLRFQTPLTNITGFRLEALPLASITGGGPGLPQNGNFVITEFEVSAAALGSPDKLQKVAIQRGAADFSQSSFDIQQTFDGATRDQRGWAVSPRGGAVHWATLQLTKPVQHSQGSVIEIKIHQFHNAAQHRLAHFRVSATTDAGELPLGLPEVFEALRHTPADARDADSAKELLAYLEKSDEKWQALKAAVAQAKQPIPPDAEIVGLQTRQKLLEVETPTDAKLVQLRIDLAASTQQLDNRKLTMAQDLAWALINSPAFLFNH